MNYRELWFIFIFTLKLTGGALLSYFIGGTIGDLILPIPGHLGGLWSCFSSLVAMRRERADSMKKGVVRVLSTSLGCLMAILAIVWWGKETMVCLTFSIFITAFVCLLLNLDEFYSPACVASAVIVILWQFFPTGNIWLFGASRLVEAVVGVSLAFAVLHIPPIDKRRFLRVNKE